VAVPVPLGRKDGAPLARGLLEEAAQPFEQRARAAHQLGQPLEVVRDVPEVLPGVALGVVALPAILAEGLGEAPVLVPADEEASRRIPGVSPAARPRVERAR